MDPITISASLLAAITVAVKDKATGAAAKYLQDAAEERARRLWGVIKERDEEKFARLMIEHVMAEAAHHPPNKALLVEPLGTVGTVGIWGPRGTLKLNLLWVNRADFPIYIRDVRVTGKVGGQQSEWDTVLGEEFTLRPRGDERRVVELDPRNDLPGFERGGATCDLSVTALVCGPWEEGRAQRTQDLMPPTGLWLPVYGIERAGLLENDDDIDIAIDHQLWSWMRQSYETYKIGYADLDRMLRLRSGAAKERLAAIAERRRHKVRVGSTIALIKFDHSSDGYPDGFAS